jgi:hypothetical protein
MKAGTFGSLPCSSSAAAGTAARGAERRADGTRSAGRRRRPREERGGEGSQFDQPRRGFQNWFQQTNRDEPALSYLGMRPSEKGPQHRGSRRGCPAAREAEGGGCGGHDRRVRRRRGFWVGSVASLSRSRERPSLALLPLPSLSSTVLFSSTLLSPGDRVASSSAART